MTTNYERGRNFEYKTRDRLYGEGAILVGRSAGSKGPADLLALFPAGLRVVQCKKDGRLPRREREALLALTSEWVSAWLARQGARGEGVVLERLEKEAA